MTRAKIKKRNLIESLLKLTRFGNLLIIGLAQYFTAAFLIEKNTVFDFHLLLLSSSTVLIAAAGYIINDYYDIKIDFINKPERVVIGRSIARRYAILFHVVLSCTGILIGASLSLRIGAVNIVSVFLLWLYSNNLKRLPLIGNVTVAFLTGLSIYMIEIYYHSGKSMILIYATFAFFMTLIREIIKDMEDLKGDNSFGCKTLPITVGVRKTKIVIYIIIFIFSITVLMINQFYTGISIYYFLVCLFIPLLILLTRLTRADRMKDYAWLSTFSKVIMLLGILSMAFS
ncbi:MAG TPA: geranylgeranylglycerol-phosphate geranylgeranyltransferase [Chryseolinea sp.]|nr:geranylgeranylglycerol-phosphate geranylgeranyltransferase [Chryseolinea sp.]HPH46831.1 geranylgeranylglycerol-phosphate geranylgeranyltransferase [Chryseolinea sp.]HPM28704.1 geranylgeranylglycerol-phosphate geranylgeranyltransferase [Chryseolinea sp.]